MIVNEKCLVCGGYHGGLQCPSTVPVAVQYKMNRACDTAAAAKRRSIALKRLPRCSD